MSHTFDRKGCWVRLDSQEAVATFRAEYQQQRGWRRLWAKLCDAMDRPLLGTVVLAILAVELVLGIGEVWVIYGVGNGVVW